MFKASVYRISPFEVESALIERPDVVECAVVPSPDPIRMAVVKAFVTLRTGAQPSRDLALSIFRHSRKALAPYKRVRRLEFVDLPKTISGKIRACSCGLPKPNAAPASRQPRNSGKRIFPSLRS